MVAFKNELVRRVNLYQPELKTVDSEYQRQLVNRFICGIEDTKLQRKLRRHCKRDKLKIDEAFNFAVDYESTEYEEKGLEIAATENHNSESYHFTKKPLAAAASSASMEIFGPVLDPDIARNRQDIEELQVGHALLDTKISQLENDMKAGFQHLEALIIAQTESENASASTPPSSSETYPLFYAATARRQ